MQIFDDEQHYRKFLWLLHEVVETYDVECCDVCLMPNHMHLLLRNRRRNLSDAMRTLKGEYAIWWNALHKRVGHVFEGPFKDQIVEEEDYVRTLARYLALNPVRAGLVKHPRDWSWSGYRAIAGVGPCPPLLSVGTVLRAFGEGETEVLRERYMQHVVQQDEQEDARAEAFRSRQCVIGSREFKQRIITDAQARLAGVATAIVVPNAPTSPVIGAV
jgi:REP element-mobilizing transposase RayT